MLPLLALLSCSRRELPKPGAPFPDFALLDTQGTVVTKASLRATGHAIILFRTDCPACKQELLALTGQRTPVRDPGSVLLIAVDSIEKARTVQREWHLPFRTCAGGLHLAKDELHLAMVPTLIRIDGDGKILAIHEGFSERESL